MTIKQICKKADIKIDDLIKKANEYYNAKISRPQYGAYKDNIEAQAILYNDCLDETLLSLLSEKNMLSLALKSEV